jgi:uncharacterized protein
MRWSKYNKLFVLPQIGSFLYNSLTNTLFELGEKTYIYLNDLKNGTDSQLKNSLFKKLHRDIASKKIIVNEWEEEDYINKRKFKQNNARYYDKKNIIMIIPTYSCNFRCPYCYEADLPLSNTRMSDKTAENILKFIKMDYREGVDLSWYGGEPLLEFERMKQITENIKKNDMRILKANMVTNGYLLDEKKVDMLDSLHINDIQVTLDGPPEIHDKRRILSDGRGTYSTILKNLDYLTDNWSGLCRIRINIDENNLNCYQDLKQELESRYKDKKVVVYGAYVYDSPESYCSKCLIQRDEWVKYEYNLYESKKVKPTSKVYPRQSDLTPSCIATNINGFVIDSVGDIYKCYCDFGKDELVLGNVNDLKNIFKDLSLQERYTVGTDLFNDKKCQDCFFLPVCDGGCPSKRLNNKYYDKNYSVCTHFKEHFIESIKLYVKLKKEHIAKEFLYGNISSLTVPADGYRILSDITGLDKA